MIIQDINKLLNEYKLSLLDFYRIINGVANKISFSCFKNFKSDFEKMEIKKNIIEKYETINKTMIDEFLI